MQIIQDIGGWLAKQPPWLSDCARRLFQQGTLGLDDKEDVVALVKVHHGFKDPKGRQPAPLDPAQLPAAAQEGVDGSLRALRDPKSLNAIDSQQSLTFVVDDGVALPKQPAISVVQVNVWSHDWDFEPERDMHDRKVGQ